MYPNLLAEMARNKITNRKLAEVLGVRQGTISLKLAGKNSLKLEECIKIRDAIDKKLTLEYLFVEGVGR